LTLEDERVVDVSIDGYTVKVAGRMYNIGHLVSTRVDRFAIGFVGGPLAAIWSKKWWLLGGLLFTVSNDPIEIRLVAFLVLLGTIGVIVNMLRGRGTGYRLTLETAFGAEIIETRDPAPLHELADAIGAAINNPPKTVAQYVIHGDLVQQTGNNNVAVQVR
jgi:hypothetical protein